MEDEFMDYIGPAIGIMLLWGVFGLINGKGFFGAIEMNIDMIGDIVSEIIKLVLYIGVFTFVISSLNKYKKGG